MQGGIKYHFLSLWYDSTWDWNPVSRAIGEHSTHLAKSLNRRKRSQFTVNEYSPCPIILYYIPGTGFYYL